MAPDVLNLRTVSMRYDGWDTHNDEYARIGNNLADVFGLSGGLATTMQQIASIPTLGPLASDQLVFYVASDFGRQLIANGDHGTDHGRGICSMLIGHDVTGGVYGEIFPERESSPDSNGKIPLQTSGADILGQTSTDRILAEACEWMQAGSSASVFPNASSTPLETPGLLDGLLSI
jgi:hypothetical protein